MRLLTNRHELLRTGLVGEVVPPLADAQPYQPGVFGEPFLLPGMGGVTLRRVGEAAFGWAADHLEPGASLYRQDPGGNHALQFLSCVGNRVRVLTGGAAGAEGRVTGKHAYVLVDFPLDVLERLAVGDRMLVRAEGVGLRLLAHPGVLVKNLAPELLERMGVRELPDGRLGVPVRRTIPRVAMGAGVGMHSDFANCDLMFRSRAEAERLGLADLRIGDIVALEDQDHRYGRGFLRGAFAIGVISTGMCQMFGHGPGATTLLAGAPGTIEPLPGPSANLRDLIWARAGEVH